MTRLLEACAACQRIRLSLPTSRGLLVYLDFQYRKSQCNTTLLRHLSSAHEEHPTSVGGIARAHALTSRHFAESKLAVGTRVGVSASHDTHQILNSPTYVIFV